MTSTWAARRSRAPSPRSHFEISRDWDSQAGDDEAGQGSRGTAQPRSTCDRESRRLVFGPSPSTAGIWREWDQICEMSNMWILFLGEQREKFFDSIRAKRVIVHPLYSGYQRFIPAWGLITLKGVELIITNNNILHTLFVMGWLQEI